MFHRSKTVKRLHAHLLSGIHPTVYSVLANSKVASRPDLCFVLVDLRNHGGSSHFDRDNTLMQCAVERITIRSVILSIVGHSFGESGASMCSTYFQRNRTNLGIGFFSRCTQYDQDQNEVRTVLLAECFERCSGVFSHGARRIRNDFAVDDHQPVSHSRRLRLAL